MIDSRGWNYLRSESGLRTFIDAQAREQWRKQLVNGDVPELTAANIEATFTQLYGVRGDMFERGVIECFRRLSWDYRTNQPFRFRASSDQRWLEDRATACTLCIYRRCDQPANDAVLQRVVGIYRRSMMLASGRYAMLDDGMGLSVVPWTPVVEERLGTVLSASVNGNSVSWTVGQHRSRGVG